MWEGARRQRGGAALARRPKFWPRPFHAPQAVQRAMNDGYESVASSW